MADTAANRRLTFGQVGRVGAVRAQVQGMLVFGVSLAFTSGALLALAALAAHPATWVQLGVLIAANLLAGLVRFMLLRNWVFALRRASGTGPGRKSVTPVTGHAPTPGADPTSFPASRS